MCRHSHGHVDCVRRLWEFENICPRVGLNMERTSTVGGIFLQEPPQILAMQVRNFISIIFSDLYSICRTKRRADETFFKCIELVHTQWTERDFDEEHDRFVSLWPKAADVFGQSFILFVRLMHQDPAAESKVSVRLTIPPLRTFVRRLLRHVASNAYVSSGRFFATDTDLLCQDHTCMQCIRLAFQDCADEYVYVESQPAAKDGETVDPDDSASNAGSHSVQPEHASEAQERTRILESGHTNLCGKDEYSSSESRSAVKGAVRSRRSAITSFEMVDQSATGSPENEVRV